MFFIKNIETRLTMRQYTLQLLLREDIFQNIDHIPDTMVIIFVSKNNL